MAACSCWARWAPSARKSPGKTSYASTDNGSASLMAAKLPPGSGRRWNQELVKPVNSAAVKAELLKHGMLAEPGTPQELAQTIAAESQFWGPLIRERKITVD